MKDKIDINICYRKVFEMIGHSCTVQELVQSISEFTGVTLVVMNIAGDVLAASSGKVDTTKQLLEEIPLEETLLELIFDCIDGKENGNEMRTKVVDEKSVYRMVNIISVRGNDEGICILSSQRQNGHPFDKEILDQLNELICKALSLLMDYSEEIGSNSHCRTSALRKIAAKVLFEKGCNKNIKLRQIKELYDVNLKSGFIQGIIRLEEDCPANLQKIGEMISDFHENLFYYTDEKHVYMLFCGVKNKERIYKNLLDICEKYKVYCGVSDLFEDTDIFCKQRFLITKALDIGKKQNPEQRMYQTYDYYMQIVSSCAVDAIGHARYLEKELQQLKKEDESKGTEFYDTLKEYLLMRNNVSETAKRLFVHRNTMIYRLRRISEFLKIDINDPAISQRLLISIMLQEQEMVK